MSKSKFDQFGRIVDPEHTKLMHEILLLAGLYRLSCDDEIRQGEIIREYQEALNKLYALGWDVPFYDNMELPEEYMPAWYLELRGPHPIKRFEYDPKDIQRDIDKIRRESRLGEPLRKNSRIDMKEIDRHLCDLSSIYRLVHDDEALRDEAIEVYQGVLNKLKEIDDEDWYLTIDMELPEKYMPAWYVEHRGPLTNPFEYDYEGARQRIDALKQQKKLEKSSRKDSLVDRLLKLLRRK